MTIKTRQQRKAIPTMSWLFRKADKLSKQNLDEWHKLRTSWTEEFLKDVRVRMKLADRDSDCVFELMREGQVYAQIKGFKYRDEFYTLYLPVFSATKYSKRMQKWLPFTLPEGSCSSARFKGYNNKPCEFFNADGTRADVENGLWQGGRPRKPGRPSTSFFVIRDRDGKFVDCRGDSGLMQRAQVASNHGGGGPLDIQHGFLPGSVTSKMDWYRSIGEGTLWDGRKMQTLAARVHKEAIELCRKYPHIRMALYPMKRAEAWNPNRYHDYMREPLDVMRFQTDSNEETRPRVVLGRDEKDNPLWYYLPELVVYWTIKADDSDRYGVPVEQVRFIHVTIPPVGSASLIRTEDEKGLSYTGKNYAGPESSKNMQDYSVARSWASAKRTRAFNARNLICLKAGLWKKETVYRWSIGDYSNDRVDHAMEAKILHNWDQAQNVVVVGNHSEDSLNDNCYQLYAAKPEGVFQCIEERELIDSLPLC